MQLHEALIEIANRFQLPLSDLLIYAREDTVGGFAFNPADQLWPAGSIWGVEGQVLYALTRALKPERVLEIGIWAGCSSTHILAALARNGSGELISIDNGIEGYPDVGGKIPLHLRERHTIIDISFEEFILDQPKPFDLIFDDASHESGLVGFIWAQAMDLLTPGGVVVSHDAMHSRIGAQVRQGVEMVCKDAAYLLIEPADCGLALYRKYKKEAAPVDMWVDHKVHISPGQITIPDLLPDNAVDEIYEQVVATLERKSKVPSRKPRKQKAKA